MLLFRFFWSFSKRNVGDKVSKCETCLQENVVVSPSPTLYQFDAPIVFPSEKIKKM